MNSDPFTSASNKTDKTGYNPADKAGDKKSDNLYLSNFVIPTRATNKNYHQSSTQL